MMDLNAEDLYKLDILSKWYRLRKAGRLKDWTIKETAPGTGIWLRLNLECNGVSHGDHSWERTTLEAIAAAVESEYTITHDSIPKFPIRSAGTYGVGIDRRRRSG